MDKTHHSIIDSALYSIIDLVKGWDPKFTFTMVCFICCFVFKDDIPLWSSLHDSQSCQCRMNIFSGFDGIFCFCFDVEDDLPCFLHGMIAVVVISVA